MIKLYYKDGCGNCSKVKVILQAYGIKYEPINLSEPDKREERRKIREVGVRLLPIIMLEDGKMITECNEESIIAHIRYGDIK